MPDWATMARRALGKVTRATGNNALTRPAFVAGYEVVASLASRLLVDLPHAESVYLAGSLLAHGSVVPGVSDIDLLVVARLPTCEAELEFRAALRKRWRLLTTVAPAFYNLDYLDVRDAPFMAAFGNDWLSGLSGDFRRLAGTPLPDDRFERNSQERACERLIHVLLKWRKSGCHLLDPRLDVEPWVLVRAAERLLALAAAYRVDASREEPLGNLLARNSRSSQELPNVSRRGQTHRERMRKCLSTTLEIMEQFGEECTAGWNGVWEIVGGEAVGEPSAQRMHEAQILSSQGFASVYLIPIGPCASAHRVVAVGAEGEPADSVVARAERSFLGLERAHEGNRQPQRPVILTRRLWDAAALLEPSPFTGAHIVTGRCRVLGTPLPPPKAPSSAALQGLLRVRTTELFVKPRTRLLRIGKAIADERLSEDLRRIPATSRGLDTGVLDLGGVEESPFVSAGSPEPKVLEALRAWTAERREVLRPELERRRKTA